ncbi:MAG TPA: recombinase family protein [Verrucomicrobiales bacterium]|nr:recombinase family protein [Verrucomicrobiales bacterium]
MDSAKKGQAPYGFRWSAGRLALVEPEAAVRRRATDLYLTLGSMGAVARALNSERLPTRRGGEWSDKQVARILSCPSAIGQYEDPSGNVFECDAIIPKALWERVQGKSREVSRAPERERMGPLFAGLAWCRCGGALAQAGGSRNLACGGCGAVIAAADLEAIFAEDFHSVASSDPLLSSALAGPSAERERAGTVASLRARLNSALSERAAAERMLAESAITKRRFEELHVPLDREVRDLQARISSAGEPPKAAEPPSLESWLSQWKSWPPSRRRSILEAFVARIEVAGGDIDISYLLPDSPESSPKDAPELRHLTSPTNQTSEAGPTYVRLPKPGQKCPHTGLSRAKLNELILPNERNNFSPPVASKSLRQKGAQRGIRLVLLESLMAHLSGSGP